MQKGTKLYRRDTGEEKGVDYFFIEGHNQSRVRLEEPLKWRYLAAIVWDHSYVWVAFTDGTTDVLYNVLETNLYMSKEEYKLFKETFQPWDERDLVPDPS